MKLFLMQITLIVWGIFLVGNHALQAQCDHPDYEAMIAFYNAVEGNNWTYNDQWAAGAAGENCNPCTYEYVKCNGEGRVTKVVAAHGSRGVFPVQIYDLEFLEELELSGDNLVGELPSDIDRLQRLVSLDLAYSSFEGALPPAIGNIPNLKEIRIFNSDISGEIPSELGNLTKLEELTLLDLGLTGTLPASLGNCREMRSLELSGNKLTGEIPATYGNFTKAEDFDVGRNQLEGSIPGTLSMLPLTCFIGLYDNNLSGCIPNALHTDCRERNILLRGNPQLENGGDFNSFCIDGLGACEPINDMDTSCHQEIIVPNDMSGVQGFGRAMNIYDDYLLVSGGGFQNTDAKVWVFQKVNGEWIEKAILIPNEIEKFSASVVALHDNYAIIGSTETDSRAGAAYIFKREGENWRQTAKLTPTERTDSYFFGQSVAIYGDYAVIGEGSDAGYGAAYIFKREGENWTEQVKLTAEPFQQFDTFGQSVAIQDGRVIVGAYQGEKVHVYKQESDQWIREAVLTAPNSDGFGIDIDIDEDWIIVGDFDNNRAVEEGGAVHFFKREGTNWNLHSTKTALNTKEGNRFGFRVAISGSNAIISSQNNNGNSETGLAHIFQFDGIDWIEREKRVSPKGDDRYGCAVEISEEEAFVGAYAADDIDGAVFKCPLPDLISTTYKPSSSEDLWTVFPNPVVDGRFYIEVKDEQKPINIKVIDVVGNVLMRKEILSTYRGSNLIEIELTNPHSGILFIQLEKGKQRSFKKIFVK